MGLSRQKYWSGLPFPFPGYPHDPGFKPTSPSLAGRLFTTELPVKPANSRLGASWRLIISMTHICWILGAYRVSSNFSAIFAFLVKTFQKCLKEKMPSLWEFLFYLQESLRFQVVSGVWMFPHVLDCCLKWQQEKQRWYQNFLTSLHDCPQTGHSVTASSVLSEKWVVLKVFRETSVSCATVQQHYWNDY